jgi:hypothetical protein
MIPQTIAPSDIDPHLFWLLFVVVESCISISCALIDRTWNIMHQASTNIFFCGWLFFSFYSKDKEESLITVSAISDVECITSMLIVLLCFLVFATMIVLRFGQESTLYIFFLPHKPPLLLYLQFIQQFCQDNIWQIF